jgi:ATP/maltotriose-dependent transcriptional regulator MalT
VLSFTVREQQVIDCLFQAMCGKEIAQELGMALRTVKRHIRVIAQKLRIDYRQFHLRVRIVYLLSQRSPYVM